MTPLTRLIEKSRGNAEKAAELEAKRHYSLESGCDAWLELRKIYEQFTRDVPLLSELLVKAVETLGEIISAGHKGDGTTTECHMVALAEDALTELAEAALKGSGG